MKKKKWLLAIKMIKKEKNINNKYDEKIEINISNKNDEKKKGILAIKTIKK